MNVPYVKQIVQDSGRLLNPIKDGKYSNKFLNRSQRAQLYKGMQAEKRANDSNKLNGLEVKQKARLVAVSRWMEKIKKCKTNKYKLN